MNTSMRLNHYPSHDNCLRKHEKLNKYSRIHKTIKTQAKVFRKKYEIEQALEKKEQEANDCCNIFRKQYDYDDKCIDIYEEIEHMERQLKTVRKKLDGLKFFE